MTHFLAWWGCHNRWRHPFPPTNHDYCTLACPPLPLAFDVSGTTCRPANRRPPPAPELNGEIRRTRCGPRCGLRPKPGTIGQLRPCLYPGARACFAIQHVLHPRRLLHGERLRCELLERRPHQSVRCGIGPHGNGTSGERMSEETSCGLAGCTVDLTFRQTPRVASDKYLSSRNHTHPSARLRVAGVVCCM